MASVLLSNITDANNCGCQEICEFVSLCDYTIAGANERKDGQIRENKCQVKKLDK